MGGNLDEAPFKSSETLPRRRGGPSPHDVGVERVEF